MCTMNFRTKDKYYISNIMIKTNHLFIRLLALFLLFSFLSVDVSAQDKQLTFEDIMKWKDISDTEISENGTWLAYSTWPDRGDGEARVQHVENGTEYMIELGDDPRLTTNGSWVGATLKAPLAKQLNEEDKDHKPGLALLNTETGETEKIDSVETYRFSNDEKWVAVHYHPSKEIEDKKSDNSHIGSELTLKNLESGSEINIPFVSEVAIDSTSNYLVYSVVDTSGSENGLYARDLSGDEDSSIEIDAQEKSFYNNLTWDDHNKRLVFTTSELDDDNEPGAADLQVWDADSNNLNTLVTSEDVSEEYALRTRNNLEWTNKGERLFFGLRDQEMVALDENDGSEDPDSVEVYNIDHILDEREVDVWHWDDPQIKTHEKETWNNRKNHLYRAVYHLDDEEWVQLADKEVPDIQTSENDRYVLASSDLLYQKLQTWDGTYRDYYIVDLQSGEKQQVVEKLRSWATLSPEGNFVLYYDEKDWHLYDVEDGSARNLTEGVDVAFYDKEDDRPRPAPAHGLGGWVEGDDAVLLYDKYDIWKFDTSGDTAENITKDGRDRELVYRIEDLDEEQRWFDESERVLLEGYYDKKKTYGFHTMQLNTPGTAQQLEEPKRFNFVHKPENSDRIFYTREAYDEYPNIWVSDDLDFGNVEQLTEMHTDLHDEYNWGHAELIEWKSVDGNDVQGALIKPDDYDEDKEYPVLVYFYELYSQRAYEFNSVRNDTRPTLPQWVGDDYVVFLPDVYYDEGLPGYSATKHLVPGVQKLIDQGIADPDKLGLHGHSWSGYQTAFMITQTDIFDAAIAGAPVSNMTSAYSGIRWGTGLARQFQYEQTQSRIGGTLWEDLDLYIENSPVFYADRIETPLMMMFGDADTAVPWYQGIEMYLAMRRLGKDSVFLQYHDEPHHLTEYANRLDYAIKMKEYFDHYLKGQDAPQWIDEGIPYQGD